MDMPDLTTAEIAATYGVSLRTARRHKAAGTLPDEQRTVGLDGKTYAASAASYDHARRPSTALTADLAAARNALRRIGRSPSFAARDLKDLQDLLMEGLMVKGQWQDGRRFRLD